MSRHPINERLYYKQSRNYKYSKPQDNRNSYYHSNAPLYRKPYNYHSPPDNNRRYSLVNNPVNVYNTPLRDTSLPSHSSNKPLTQKEIIKNNIKQHINKNLQENHEKEKLNTDEEKLKTHVSPKKNDIDLEKSNVIECKPVVTPEAQYSVPGNVLSCEQAMKSIKRKNSDKDKSENSSPTKKQKIDDSINNSIKPVTTTNKYKTLEQFYAEKEAIKLDIKEQLNVVRAIKEKFEIENDKLKEMKLRQKILGTEFKKICRAMFREEKEKSDSDVDVQVGGPNEIIDLETSSDEDNNENDGDDSDSSVGVEIVTETRKAVVNSVRPRGTSSSSDSSSSLTNNNTSHNKTASLQPKSTNPIANSSTEKRKQSLTPKTEVISAPISKKEDKTNNKNTNAPILCSTTSKSTIKSPNIITKAKENVTKSPIKTSTINKNPQNHIKIAETKTNTGDKIKKEIHPTYLESDSPENIKLEDHSKIFANLKADAENGLFNAIEPKLSTIIVTKADKTFITDIKIFNNRLFMSASHGLLQQYHLASHQCLKTYIGHHNLIHCILPTAHPRGLKRLISGGFDQKLLIHDIDTGAILSKLESDRPIMALCELMDYVYIGTGGGGIIVFSLDNNKKKGKFQVSESGISCLSATKDNNRHLLFVGTNDGEYSVYDALTYVKIKVITPTAHVETPIGFVVLQKQRVLAFTKNHVHFLYYAKKHNVASFNHFSSINSLCLTKNYVIVGSITGNVSVYKLKGSLIPKNPILSLDNSKSSIISLTFYNNTIISGDKNGRIFFNRLVES